MPAAFLARVGLVVFAMLFGTALVTERPADGRPLIARASQSESDAREVPQVPQIPQDTDGLVAAAAVPGPVAPEPEPEAVLVARWAVGSGDLVLASWYGPGFYGNRTACGQTYTPQLLGVAHLTLPCGSVVTLGHGFQTVTVPVIDRGPYVAGRTFDLSSATKAALGCTDLCTVRMQLTR